LSKVLVDLAFFTLIEAQPKLGEGKNYLMERVKGGVKLLTKIRNLRETCIVGGV
jgi:hypothetical protein